MAESTQGVVLFASIQAISRSAPAHHAQVRGRRDREGLNVAQPGLWRHASRIPGSAIHKLARSFGADQNGSPHGRRRQLLMETPFCMVWVMEKSESPFLPPHVFLVESPFRWVFFLERNTAVPSSPACVDAGAEGFGEWATTLDDHLAEITSSLPSGELRFGRKDDRTGSIGARGEHGRCVFFFFFFFFFFFL